MWLCPHFPTSSPPWWGRWGRSFCIAEDHHWPRAPLCGVVLGLDAQGAASDPHGEQVLRSRAAGFVVAVEAERLADGMSGPVVGLDVVGPGFSRDDHSHLVEIVRL